MLSRRDLDFLLHEWLDVQSLCDRARFASLRRDHFDAVLAQASQLARGCRAPANRQPGRQAFRCLPCLTAQRKPGILVTILHGLSFCGH